MFKRKYESQDKIIDLSLLPPCKKSLHLHIRRACYVAKIWRLSQTPKFELPPIENHGWTKDYEVKWIETAFPEDLTAILVENDLEENIFEETDESSDEEDGEDN